MTKDTYEYLQRIKRRREELQLLKQSIATPLTDAEREAVNIVGRAITYSLDHIRPEEDDDTTPLIFSDIEGMQALSEDIERLNLLELTEETRAEYLALIKGLYGVA